MKKNCAVLTAAALSCAVLAGCGQKQEGTWNANENSIYVTKELAVESAMVYTSDKPNELYTVEGLSSYVEEAVTSYNTEHGGAAAFENEKDQEKVCWVFGLGAGMFGTIPRQSGSCRGTRSSRNLPDYSERIRTRNNPVE